MYNFVKIVLLRLCSGNVIGKIICSEQVAVSRLIHVVSRAKQIADNRLFVLPVLLELVSFHGSLIKCNFRRRSYYVLQVRAERSSHFRSVRERRFTRLFHGAPEFSATIGIRGNFLFHEILEQGIVLITIRVISHGFLQIGMFFRLNECRFSSHIAGGISRMQGIRVKRLVFRDNGSSAFRFRKERRIIGFIALLIFRVKFMNPVRVERNIFVFKLCSLGGIKIIAYIRYGSGQPAH